MLVSLFCHCEERSDAAIVSSRRFVNELINLYNLDDEELHTPDQQGYNLIMSFYTAVITLILIMDPLGNIPIFISALKHIPLQKRRWIVIRESLIALGILTAFLFFGQYIIEWMSLSDASLSIAGGIILFIIAIKMIFPDANGGLAGSVGDDPFIVPLAMPFIAGPSAMAWVMLMATRKNADLHTFGALLIAWLVSTTVLYFCHSFSKYLGNKGLSALERLMGMILTTISVQMFLDGLGFYFHIK